MAKITIYGKTYSLKSSSSEVSIEEAAAYVDAKMHELAGLGKNPLLWILRCLQLLILLKKHCSYKRKLRLRIKTRKKK